ncbi:unnamed protein product [Phyllotreta striolata]|uniref:MORN repeat-containing protein 3 n=1 Tax=Phyllotreta striolata TaxID=444603 RepID=A0A9N9TXD7_PHYSR|nr:unnamed protein product [Phyllotreta striolata]
MPFYNRIDVRKLPRSRQLEEGSYKNGQRHCIFNAVHDKYTGEWKRDKKTGKGALLTRNMDLYEGDFLNNYRHGHGILAYLLPKYKVFRLAYSGEWKFGRMHGKGLRDYPGEGFYLGFFQHGKRHGCGQMFYHDGAFYDGNWIEDKREGIGLFLFKNGNRYEGNWLNDKKNGKGMLYFLNVGQIMIGFWNHDVCASSTITDLPYRQAAMAPTLYPIPKNTLVTLEIMCKNAELVSKSEGSLETLMMHYNRSLAESKYF